MSATLEARPVRRDIDTRAGIEAGLALGLPETFLLVALLCAAANGDRAGFKMFLAFMPGKYREMGVVFDAARGIRR